MASGLVLHYAAEALGGARSAYTVGLQGFGGEGEYSPRPPSPPTSTRCRCGSFCPTRGQRKATSSRCTCDIDETNGDPTARPLRALAELAAQGCRSG